MFLFRPFQKKAFVGNGESTSLTNNISPNPVTLHFEELSFTNKQFLFHRLGAFTQLDRTHVGESRNARDQGHVVLGHVVIDHVVFLAYLTDLNINCTNI